MQARAYQTPAGATSIGGPGYGNYEQTALQHVNAGDLVAMQLTNNTHGNVYLGFAQANEVVNGQSVVHLWNYGLNTWGWEDTSAAATTTTTTWSSASTSPAPPATAGWRRLPGARHSSGASFWISQVMSATGVARSRQRHALPLMNLERAGGSRSGRA